MKGSSYPTMKTGMIAALLSAAFLTAAHAQRGEPEVPMMRPEELLAIQEQAAQLYDAIRPVGDTARQSTVWIMADTGRGRRPVGFGTVVEDGTRILTKWSEIAMAQGNILAVGFDNTSAKTKVVGVYQDEDLAVLKTDGVTFKPIKFSEGEAPKLGKMLIAASPDETPTVLGVVAVEARSLREKDQAFLGVGLDNTYKGSGVKIREVQEESGASEAGLKSGDVILSIGGRAVNSLFEMRNALTGFGPGEAVDIRYTRKGEEQRVKATMKEKPEFEGFPNGRLRQMERMGTRPSLVKTGFPSAIQTDMQLERDRCGGPVVDLDGNVVGISIARADRTRSFILSAAHILKVLNSDPLSEDAARAAMSAKEDERQQVTRNDDEAGPQQPRPQVIPLKPGSADRLRRHLEDMDRLMERMKEEMEGMEE